MNIDRLYFPVTTLGPGERVALWTRGCTKHCPGCANPELWDTGADSEIAIDRLASVLLDLAKRTGVHRLTVTGGDPLEQASALADLLAHIRPAFDDILVYTGFTAEELGAALPSGTRDALFGSPDALAPPSAPRRAERPANPSPLIDVLIDGPYVESLNDGACGLRGSTNQRVIVLNAALENLYHEEERKPRRVQNAVFDGRALSIGIHGRPDET